MPRNFGVTVNDSRFESFIDSAAKLERLQLRVGILSGKPKYPAGWVGTKSRLKDNYNRFSALREGAKNPDRERSMLGAYRNDKRLKKWQKAAAKARDKGGSPPPQPGYSRKARRKRVAVAKVAAVVGFEATEKKPSAGVAIASKILGAKLSKSAKGGRPKLPGLWIEATEKAQPFLQQQAERAMQLALDGQSPKAPLVRFGEKLRIGFVAAVIREGHVDSRRLINTINWEITDLKRELFLRKMAAAQNKAKRLERAAKKAAKAR